MEPTASDERHSRQLIHCIYVSAAVHPMSRDELEDILVCARRQNARLHVTGILLYVEGSFMQVLEGEAATVDRLFTTISHDARHTGVTRIIREVLPHRYFDGWSMGFSAVSTQELGEIVGDGECLHTLASLDSGRASRLLLAFREGRWRHNLTAAAHATD